MSALQDPEKVYEKDDGVAVDTLAARASHGAIQAGDDEFEIFKERAGDGEVKYRNMHWLQASAVFLKVQFSLGVLSIPFAFAALGSVGASFCVIGFGIVNTGIAIFLGRFRNKYPGVHSIADMAGLVGGPIAKEIAGLWFVVGYILCVGAGYLAISVAFNTFSNHGACTVVYVVAALIICTVISSAPRLSEISWVSFAGAVSIIVSVFVMVIAVAVRDRPYAAPATAVAPYGWQAFANADFSAGITSVSLIFVSSSGHSAFIPVISEMRRPQDYNKAVYLCYGITNTCYLVFSLIVFRYAGSYVASPSLGSAGPTMQKVCYALAFVGLVASAVVYHHVAAKYIFVRILRHSRHLQQKTAVHWGTWLGSTVFVGGVSFILAEAVPIFNFLIALLGSFCFAPMALIMPSIFWFYYYADELRSGRNKTRLMAIVMTTIMATGFLIFIGGTYAVCVQIRDAYRSGAIGSAFSCDDNSGLSK